MKKCIKFMMLLLVTTVCLSVTACGGDDETDQPDYPDNPENPTSVVKGTVSISGSVYVEDGYYDYIRFYFGDYGYTPQVFVECVGSYQNAKICYVGNVSSVSEIKNAPTSGWGSCSELKNNGGYIISYSEDGIAYYVRLMVTSNYDISGTLIGVNYAYQQFTPSNL